jgi:hypothetical protein
MALTADSDNQKKPSAPGVAPSPTRMRRWIWWLLLALLVIGAGATFCMVYFGRHILLIHAIERQGGWVDTEPIVTGVSRELVGRSFVHYFERPIGVNFDSVRVDKSGMAAVEEFSGLKWFGIGRSTIPEGSLRHLAGQTSLERLVLWQSNVGDADLVHLAKLNRLLDLWLAETKVTSDGLESLSGLSALSRLDLSKTNVDDSGLLHLRDLRRLEQLFLVDTQVQGPGLQHLIALPELTFLWLRGSPIDDDGLAHLRGCASLRVLDLSGTRISDQGLETLLSLPSLVSVNLNDTAISDAGLKTLQKLDRLVFLGINGTQVTSERYLEFSRALPKCDVDWKPETDAITK